LFTRRRAKLAKTPLAREKRLARAHTLGRQYIIILIIIVMLTLITSPSVIIIAILAITLNPIMTFSLTLKIIEAIIALLIKI
jgi:hypothetical protein